jgi:opacity protein-like surface antigen
MKRHAALVLIATLAIPCAASAQLMTPPPTRWSVTPLVGWAFSSKVKGDVVIGAAGKIQTGTFDYDVGGGPITGVAAEYMVIGRLAARASIRYNSRGTTESTTALNGDLIPGSVPGSSLWIAVLGGRFELVEPESSLQITHPRAFVHAGLALVHESPSSSLPLASSQNHPGVNFGVDAELPTAVHRVSVRFGFEDTYMFWRNAGIQENFDREFTSEFASPAVTAVNANNAHAFALTAGVAFHF